MLLLAVALSVPGVPACNTSAEVPLDANPWDPSSMVTVPLCPGAYDAPALPPLTEPHANGLEPVAIVTVRAQQVTSVTLIPAAVVRHRADWLFVRGVW
jgi:hypothetical protein